MFTDGQSALMMANLTSLFGLRNMEDEYGILPLAKYNAEQLDYTGKNNSDFLYLLCRTEELHRPGFLRLPHSRS